MSRQNALEAAVSYLDSGRFLTDLSRRVAYRSESDAGAPPSSLLGYLNEEMVPYLTRLGFACDIVENPVPTGGPMLIARRIEDAAYRTVLTYGHGDVVSGQEALWRAGLQPWTVTVEGEKWYGRGTADNKGQHTINLAALEQVITARGGKLGYNVTVLIEMGEEAGSPGLGAVCEAYSDDLKADLFIACDGPRTQVDKPTIFLGSRGMVNFTLRYQPRARGYHSGNWGGVIANPATVMANALASLVDDRGRMLVSELEPPPITDAVREALKDIKFGGGKDDPAFDAGWGEPGLSPGERLVAWNTLEVLAFGAGNPQRPVNAIPPSAVAHCQLRFVVGTNWKDLASIVRRHLDKAGYPDITAEVTMEGAASRLDLDDAWVDWARESIKKSTGASPAVLPNLAGSLPNDVFSDILGLPTLWIPHSYAACGQHGPDEHLVESVARDGLRLMAGLYWDLGEQPGWGHSTSVGG